MLKQHILLVLQVSYWHLTGRPVLAGMELQEGLVVATLGLFNICWGVMASLPVTLITTIITLSTPTYTSTKKSGTP